MSFATRFKFWEFPSCHTLTDLIDTLSKLSVQKEPKIGVNHKSQHGQIIKYDDTHFELPTFSFGASTMYGGTDVQWGRHQKV